MEFGAQYTSCTVEFIIIWAKLRVQKYLYVYLYDIDNKAQKFTYLALVCIYIYELDCTSKLVGPTQLMSPPWSSVLVMLLTGRSGSKLLKEQSPEKKILLTPLHVPRQRNHDHSDKSERLRRRGYIISPNNSLIFIIVTPPAESSSTPE